MSGIEGDVSVGDTTSEFDSSFDDLVDFVDMAFSLAVDGNNGEVGVKSDFYYIELEDSSSSAAGKVTGNVEQWIITIAPYYRVMDDGEKTVDVGVGGRYVDMDIDIEGPVADRSKGRDWIDPVITGRFMMPTANNCFLSLYADIGGFGIESDLTYQLQAVAGYAFRENMDLVLGYRHLEIDNEDGGVTYDAATSGLLLGLNIKL